MKSTFGFVKALFFSVIILSMALTACAPAAPAATQAPAAPAATEAPAAAAPAATEAPAAAPAATEAPAAPAAPVEKVLTVAAAIQNGDTFDIVNASQTMEPHTMVYETLVTVDFEYKFAAGLADSWDVSADGLTYTFHLHKGVKFTDGSDFNAKVVDWWVEKMKLGVNSYVFESLTDKKIIDDQTISMTFKSPFPNLLFNLATSFSGIPSMAMAEKCGDKFGTTPECTSGTGPYVLTEWVQNDHLTLVKNKDYTWAPAWLKHEGPANLDKIIYRIIPEDSTRSIDFESGNIDLLVDAPSPQQLEVYSADPTYVVTQVADPTIQFIGMNVDDPMLKDIRTRKAIGYAIDRDLILSSLYKGIGSTRTTYLSKEMGGDKGVDQVAPSFDPAKAKALLIEAGWELGSDGIMVAKTVEGVKPDTKFIVSIMTYQQDEYRRLVEVLQKMLSDVGVKVGNIQMMDNATYSAGLRKHETIQLILRYYKWDNGDILEWFHHSKYLPYPNYLGVKDKKFDAMLDDANYNTGLWDDRETKYVDIHKYLIETWYPWAPFRQPAKVFVTQKWVTNFQPVPLKLLYTASWINIDIQK